VRGQRVDGLIIWDWVCGCDGRPCPKLGNDPDARRTVLGPYAPPPPCVYVFPAEIPSDATPRAEAQPIPAVELLAAFHTAFGGRDSELNSVEFELARKGDRTQRRTTVRRDGEVAKASRMTPISRRG
jgi:hypothetical protein